MAHLSIAPFAALDFYYPQLNITGKIVGCPWSRANTTTPLGPFGATSTHGNLGPHQYTSMEEYVDQGKLFGKLKIDPCDNTTAVVQMEH